MGFKKKEFIKLVNILFFSKYNTEYGKQIEIFDEQIIDMVIPVSLADPHLL